MRGLMNGLGPALVLASLLSIPVSSEAQSWALVDGLGYGAIGAGVGAGMAWHLEPAAGWSVITATTGAGIVAGVLVGRAADRALARGEPLGDGHRVAVVAGSVLAGAALGGLASAALINGEGEGTFMGSDETTFTALTVGGAALGAAFTWWRQDALEPRAVTAAPTVSADGGVGLGVRVRF